jgi:hypothetical protein
MDKDNPLCTILKVIIVWKENLVNIDRVGRVTAMSKVHKNESENLTKGLLKEMEHASLESGHDSDQHGPK